MEILQSSFCTWKKNKVLRKHINALKPTLNEKKNKLQWLSFALPKCHYDEEK